MSDPAMDKAVCQSDASWAAVREARRAVNAAWVSILVNAAVVAVALGAPFIQEYAEKKRDDAFHRSVKVEVVRQIKESLDGYENDPFVDFDARYDGGIVDRGYIKLFSSALDLIAEAAKEGAERNKEYFQVSRDHFDIMRAIDRLSSVLRGLESEIKLINVQIEIEGDITKYSFENKVLLIKTELRDIIR